MLRFRFLTGDVNWVDYWGKFISRKLSKWISGERFYFWIVLDFINMWDATGDESQDKYHVSVIAVSPDEAGESGLQEAIRSCSWQGMPDVGEMTDFQKVELLTSYGLYATLSTVSGNNYCRVMTEARRQAVVLARLVNTRLDRPQNRIGSTGWDFIRGNPLTGLGL